MEETAIRATMDGGGGNVLLVGNLKSKTFLKAIIIVGY